MSRGVRTLSMLKLGELAIQDLRPSPKGTPPLVLSAATAQSGQELTSSMYWKYPESSPSVTEAAAKWYPELASAYLT